MAGIVVPTRLKKWRRPEVAVLPTSTFGRGPQGLNMFRRKIDPRVSRPQGAPDPVRPLRVDIDLSDIAAEAGPSEPDSGWLESSHDLQRGMRMRETPIDSLPADLIEALLQRRL